MPDEEAVRASFARQGALRFLGAEMESVGDGRCVLRLPFRDELSQQHGSFHAGVLATLADSAGGYAAFSLMPEGSEVLATEFKFNFLRPADGDVAVAEAQVVKSGRTLTVSRLDVFVGRGGERVHVATGLQTCICLPQAPLEE